MTHYVYILKCPDCEDEFFDFFEDAKICALKCLSDRPIITQTEVNRNDFGECTDHCDLGTVWTWEDVMGKETDAEPAISVFTKDDLKLMTDGKDPEFDNLDNSFDTPAITEDDQRLATNKRGDYLVKASSGHGYTVFNRSNVCIGGLDCTTDEEAIRRFNRGDLDEAVKVPIPEGMTIEELVEAMEENEDTVECTKCGGLFEKAGCTHNKEGFGWCCTNCEPADTLIEEKHEYDLTELVKDSVSHLTYDLGKDPWADDFADDVIVDLENNFDIEVPEDPIKYRDWCSAVASEVSRQVNKSNSKLEELEEAAAYRTHLDLCPECGAENAFDHETGFCINCGFNL